MGVIQFDGKPSRHHLDHHALDAARVAGHRLSSGRGIRRAETADGVYIVAEKLAKVTGGDTAGSKIAKTVARFPGRVLEHTYFMHPFLPWPDRKVLGVLANYVTMDQGTGAVHTAPSHGADDFYTGQRYKLDATTNVDEAGIMRHGLPEYDGKTVFQANPAIIELLRSRGALMHEERLEHSYPHCWRCHRPVIFRATEQWFISMEAKVTADGRTLRQASLDEIKKVKWDPEWGEERISNMIATRPDWCISRQRVWGVPIAVFFCGDCGQMVKIERGQPRRALARRARGRGRLVHQGRRRHPPVRDEVPMRRHEFPQGDGHHRRVVRIRIEPLRGAGPRRGPALAGGPLSRRRRPIPRLVSLFPALRRGRARAGAVSHGGDQWLDARSRGPRHVQVAGQRGRSGGHCRPHGRGDRAPVGGVGGLPRGRHLLGRADAAHLR